MYEEMMAKKQEAETNKGNIIDDLEKLLVAKDQEVMELRVGLG